MFDQLFRLYKRLFLKSPLQSIISLFSLAFGISIAIVMLLFIRYELSFDKFHENKDQIYRVSLKETTKEGESTGSAITAAVGPSFYSEFPEVIDFVRVRIPAPGYLAIKNKSIHCNKLSYVDSSFLKVFSFPLIKGDKETALSSPNSIVLSQSTAFKLFPDENAVGKSIRLNNNELLTVTGVIEDPPANSTIQYDGLISFSSLNHKSAMFLGWDGGWQFVTYLVFTRDYPVQSFNEKTKEFMFRHINQKYEQYGAHLEPVFEPLKRIYLHSQAEDSYGPQGSPGYILIFIIVTLFILALSVINFVNLKTAYSSTRAKEVGVRKVFGAKKGNLISQFMGESVGMSLFALAIALVLVEISLPMLNNFLNKDLHLFGSGHLYLIIFLPLLAVFIGLIAGYYPAFHLSSFNPVEVIHGKRFTGISKKRFFNILLLFQFIISIVLIISTATFNKQFKFILNKDTGFEKDHMLIVPLISENARKNYSLLKQKLQSLPEVTSASASSSPLGYGLTMNGYFPEGREKPVMINVVDVDKDFINTYKLEVVTGKNFFLNPGDESKYIVNQALVRMMNWDNPIGKTISRDGKHEIIGVVKDFHFAPMQQEIMPLILTNKPYAGFDNLNIRFQTTDIKSFLAKTKTVWNEVETDEPFVYSFLKNDLEQEYEQEKKMKTVLFVLTVLAILITIMGLFGLSVFTTVQRTKEIGIRKVMGANSGEILQMIIQEFSVWILIATLFAWPVSWYITQEFLSNYAYRIKMPYLYFIAASLITILLSWITIGYQSYRASVTNPAETLKYE
jgi:putative ABC transport system permease protein